MIIYKTINNINGKIYVGQDTHNNPKYLGSGIILKQAVDKYGSENFTKETLETCSNKDELNEREIYWIKKLNAQDRNVGYNICDGGSNGNSFTYHPDKENIRKRCQNSKKHLMKEVYQYDLEGNLIKKHDSVNQAANEYGYLAGEIGRCCRGDYKKYKGYLWKFELITDKESLKLSAVSCRDKQSVDQFDLDGQYLATYESISHAAKSTHSSIGSISHVLRGHMHHTNNYIWRYSVDNNQKEEY